MVAQQHGPPVVASGLGMQVDHGWSARQSYHDDARAHLRLMRGEGRHTDAGCLARCSGISSVHIPIVAAVAVVVVEEGAEMRNRPHDRRG
jgi:hypothetical protein